MAKKEVAETSGVPEVVRPAGQLTVPSSVLQKNQVDDGLDYLGHDVAGMEDMDSTDITLPRLGLCQNGSPERKKNDPKYIEGLEEGLFFNTITRKIYGEVVRVIPVRWYKQRIKFHPMDNGGGIDCQSLNGIDGGHYSQLCRTCQYSSFSEEGAPECTEFHNRVSLVVPDGDALVVSLKSTGLPMSKQWGAFAKSRNRPLFSGVYELRAVPAKRGANEFFTVAYRFVQNVSPEDFQVAKGYFDSISTKVIQVEQEHDAVDSGAGNTDF